jgi:hypothetical protein
MCVFFRSNASTALRSVTVYAMAQAQKAVLPVDEGGSVGQRVQVSVSGEQNWALRVGAYVTARVDGAYSMCVRFSVCPKLTRLWLDRYSLVVLNCERFQAV